MYGMYRAKTTSSKLGWVEWGGWEGVSFPKGIVPKWGEESLVVFSMVGQTLYFYIILIYLIEKSEVIFHFKLCL
jgi:hypothetical protein